MSLFRTARLALLALVLVLLGATLALTGEPAGAVGTTTVTGTVTTGVTPLANITVTAKQATFGTVLGSGTTNASGVYSFTISAPASFKLMFSDGAGIYLTTYNDGAASLSAAPVLSGVGGDTVTKDASMIKVKGTISGTVKNLSAVALSGITVTAYNKATGAVVGTTTTSGTGTYSFSLYPGNYRLKFSQASQVYATTYNNSALTYGAAPNIVVTSGNTTTVNQNLAPSATINGTIYAGGTTPAGLIAVALRSTGIEAVATSVTNASGAYSLKALPPGSYKIAFLDPTFLHTATANSGLRPEMEGGGDIVALSLATAFAAAPTRVITAGSTATLDATLVGWDCDPLASMTPGTSHVGASLAGKDLRSCGLANTDFSGANLTGANLAGADFSSANLTGATLDGANIESTDIFFVDLTNATLDTATGTPVNYPSSTYGNTVCPTGVNSDSNGGDCSGQPWGGGG